MTNNNWQLINRNGTRLLACADGQSFPTRHSYECLEAIYDVKGREGFRWFVDEVQRGELPNSISEHLRTMIDQMHLSDRKAVLDFGAGSGASTVALAYNGYRNIESVEIDERLIEIARLRARDFGY
jgi:2-polyprenyl-3-methyl-5-hydroxy-6-metoxy-1,4-benzoquinol methylase